MFVTFLLFQCDIIVTIILNILNQQIMSYNALGIAWELFYVWAVSDNPFFVHISLWQLEAG